MIEFVLICVFQLAALASAACGPPQELSSDEIRGRLAQLQDGYANELQELADWFREQQMPEQAKQTEAWIHRPHDRLNYIFLRPQSAESPVEADANSPATATWRQGFDQLRAEQADELFALAQAASQSNDSAMAVSLLNQTLRENPDHEAARKLLGYQKLNGRWLTEFEADKERRGEIWDSQFGWIKREDLPGYQAGKRKQRNNWITAERDAELHARMANGWRVETEHFSITTNHSLEAGAALGERLEKLHAAWWHVFAAVHLSDDQVKNGFARGELPLRAGKHRVMYLANETEFRRTLANELPTTVKTTGVYLARRKTAYFYHADPEDHATQYHEITHQLFQEVLPRTPVNLGQDSDFWLVEGIACYMESLRMHESPIPGEAAFLTTGGIDAARVQDARFYLLRDGFQAPFKDIAELGRQNFQRHPEIRKVYAQGAGMVDMLMHRQAGVSRSKLMRMLSELYAGRRNVTAGAVEVGVTDVDGQYAEYMEVTDADLAGSAAGDDVSYLALGGTQITDAGLERFASLRQVSWIDLANTAVTDAGVRHIAGLPTLVQLDLSDTRITDAALETLAGTSQLRKLSIIGTSVSDGAVQRLQSARPDLEIVR